MFWAVYPLRSTSLDPLRNVNNKKKKPQRQQWEEGRDGFGNGNHKTALVWRHHILKRQQVQAVPLFIMWPPTLTHTLSHAQALPPLLKKNNKNNKKKITGTRTLGVQGASIEHQLVLCQL